MAEEYEPPSFPVDDMPETMPVDAVVIEVIEEDSTSPLIKYLDEGNIVDELEDNAKTTTDIIDLYNEADRSMDDWRKKYAKALSLAKLQPMANGKEIEKKTFPFEGASLAMMPFILEAALDFNSRAAPELAWANEIVHAKVYGQNSKEKEARAKRVADYSNAQLSELMAGWKSDQDKAMLILPVVGTFYKRPAYCYEEQEVESQLLLADEVIFNHDYSTFEKAPDRFRKATYTRNEVIGFIRGEQGWDIDEDDLEENKEDFEFIHADTWVDLDDDGLKEPYTVTIFDDTKKTVCLYPRYDDDTVHMNDDGKVVKVLPVDGLTQYRFIPDPEGGPMGLGWGILLGPMFDSINTSVRQLIDSGTLAITSANSGLISKQLATGRGNAVKSGPIEIIMGQLTPVEVTGSLRDSIAQFPFAGPNTVLFQLMEYLVNSSRSMTNATINMQSQPGEAASLYLARLQQALKVPNVIVMRVYDCCKKELQQIALLNHRHFDDEKYNNVLDVDAEASMEADFNPKDFDVRLVADPSQGSDLERIQRAQLIYEMAKDPQQPAQVIDYRTSVLDLLTAMKTTNIEELAPESDPNAKDPMQEMILAQQMADMEMRKQDQSLRGQELELKRLNLALEQQRAAMQAAKEMSELGLKADKQEADIAETYAKTLKALVEVGSSYEQAMQQAQQIEETFIDSRTQAANPGPGGAMAQRPGDQNVPTMPMVEPRPAEGGLG